MDSSLHDHLSSSKLRRLRASTTKRKLYDAAHKDDALATLTSQVAILTNSIDWLIAYLPVTWYTEEADVSDNAPTCIPTETTTAPQLMSHVPGPSAPSADCQFTGTWEPIDNNVGLKNEGRKVDRSEVAPKSTSCILQRPLDVVPRSTLTGPSGQVSTLDAASVTCHSSPHETRQVQATSSGAIKQVDVSDAAMSASPGNELAGHHMGGQVSLQYFHDGIRAAIGALAHTTGEYLERLDGRIAAIERRPIPKASQLVSMTGLSNLIQGSRRGV